MLETAASAAGECLVDLNTREGDWFLDGLRMTSALIAEMVSVISTVGNSDDVQGKNGQRIRIFVIDCLDEFDANSFFYSILFVVYMHIYIYIYYIH